MKNVLRIVFVVSFAALLNASALAQRAVPPPPKPADSGPSLAVTMQFIQDRMNNQGMVGYVYTSSDLPGDIFRKYFTISGVAADPSACTLQTTDTIVTTLELAPGHTFREGGKPVTGDDLSRRHVATGTIHLRDVDSIRVESMQDAENRRNAEDAHPEITITIVPAVYYLTLIASKPAFTFHSSTTIGKRPAKEWDSSGKSDQLIFRDEETADRMAKALTHAVELCGGGDKDLFAPTAQEKNAMERTRQLQTQQQASQFAARQAQLRAQQQAQLQAQQAQQAQEAAEQAQENAQQQAISDCQQQCSADYDACKSAAKSQMKTGAAIGFLGKLLKTTSVADSITSVGSNAVDSFSACNDANSSCTAACQ
jgi:hypothetical protein